MELRLVPPATSDAGHRGEFLARICAVRLGLLLPQYLGEVHGYNSEQIGSDHGLDGIAAVRENIPFVPKLMAKFDARAIVSVASHLCGKQPHEHAYVELDDAADQYVGSKYRACDRGTGPAAGAGGRRGDGSARTAEELGAASGVFNTTPTWAARSAPTFSPRLGLSGNNINRTSSGSSAATLFRETVRDRMAHLTSYSRRMAASTRRQTRSSSCRSREDHSTAIADLVAEAIRLRARNRSRVVAVLVHPTVKRQVSNVGASCLCARESSLQQFRRNRRDGRHTVSASFPRSGSSERTECYHRCRGSPWPPLRRLANPPGHHSVRIQLSLGRMATDHSPKTGKPHK